MKTFTLTDAQVDEIVARELEGALRLNRYTAAAIQRRIDRGEAVPAFELEDLANMTRDADALEIVLATYKTSE